MARPGSTRARGNAPASGAPGGWGWVAGPGPSDTGHGAQATLPARLCPKLGRVRSSGRAPVSSGLGPGAPALGRRGRGHGRAGLPGRTTGRHLRTFWKCFPLLSWLALRREDRREMGEEQPLLPKPASPESTNNQGPAVQESP